LIVNYVVALHDRLPAQISNILYIRP